MYYLDFFTPESASQGLLNPAKHSLKTKDFSPSIVDYAEKDEPTE